MRIYLAPTSIKYSSPVFLVEKREPHGIPIHVAIVVWCATVCLTVMASLSDMTDVSTICQTVKTDRGHIPLFHVAQYEDDIIGQKLNHMTDEK